MAMSEGSHTGVRYKWCRFTTSRGLTKARIPLLPMSLSDSSLDAFARIAALDRNSIAIRKMNKKYRQEKTLKVITPTWAYNGELEMEEPTSLQLAKPKNFYTSIDSPPRPESPVDPILDSTPDSSIRAASPVSSQQSESTMTATSPRCTSPAYSSSAVSFLRASSLSPTPRAASPEIAPGIGTSVLPATSSNAERPESPVASPPGEESSAKSSRAASPTMSSDTNASVWSAASSITRSESPPPTLSAIAAASLWSAAIAVPIWNPTPVRNGRFFEARNNAPQSSNWSAASHLLHWSATAPDYSWNATPPSLLWNCFTPTSVWDAPSTPTLWNGVSPISLLNGALPSTLWSGSSPASSWSRAAPASLWNDASMSHTWNAALALSPWIPNMPGSSWSHIAPRLSKSGKYMLNYRIKKPLTLSCYTSEHGVAAVLIRNLEDGTECQVAVEMRTFLVCERSYSDIDKGVASVLFGVRKCHKYLTGRAFTIVTDQEPLVRIFDPKRPIPNEYSPRYVKAAIALMSYHYDIVYQPVTNIPKFTESLE